jgi:hypothetical protein
MPGCGLPSIIDEPMLQVKSIGNILGILRISIGRAAFIA